jgi:hypothetical protein
MDREVAFKAGKDLGSEGGIAAQESIICESCGAIEAIAAAADAGWQIEPAVCPDCLRWRAVSSASLVADREAASNLRVERRGRFWAVYESGELLCVTVYRKGARAVVDRLTQARVGEERHGSR